MLLMLVVTVTGNFGMAPMELLYFDPEKVLKFQVGQAALQCSACNPAVLVGWPPRPHSQGCTVQVWRMVTNFFFLGPLGFGFLMHMMIL